MKSSQIRTLWNQFRTEKNHKTAKPVSLVAPSEDKTVLFNVAGMQPLVPYLSGKPHPNGDRIYNIQKCIRTNDIEDIGDERHLSMFEMMGNRSLGDYFKKESLIRSWEFLTNEKYLNLDPNKIGCSVFWWYEKDGEVIIPYDQEAHDTLLSLGMNPKHIKAIPMFHGEKCDNFWWPAGAIWPCGPCAEFHYDRGDDYGPNDWNIGINDRFIEIWNNVFMEFYKDEKGEYAALSQQNVDTGMGMERLTMVLQEAETIFETDLFFSSISLVENFTSTSYPALKKNESLMSEVELAVTKSYRIILDHVRASIFLLSDGVVPSNEGRWYVLRRLIRRAWFHLNKLHADHNEKELHNFIHDFTNHIFELFDKQYSWIDQSDTQHKEEIAHRLLQEIDKFLHTLQKGEKQLKKTIQWITSDTLSGDDVFLLYDTFGFPVELTQEIAQDAWIKVDILWYEKAMSAAKKKAKSSSKDKFTRGVDRAKYLEGVQPTEFIWYDTLESLNPTILKQFQLDDGQRIMVFDRTPFYATWWWQTGDNGTLELDDGTLYTITNVIKYSGVFLHFVE